MPILIGPSLASPWSAGEAGPPRLDQKTGPQRGAAASVPPLPAGDRAKRAGASSPSVASTLDQLNPTSGWETWTDMTAAQKSATGDRRWERFAPAGALGFLLTIAIGAFVIGEGTPSSKAPAQHIAAYFAEHRGDHFLNATLVMMGAFVLYPWFLAGLYRAIRRAEGETGILAVAAFIGGLTLLGPVLLQAAGWGAAALEAGPSRDASVAAGLMDLGNMGFLLVPFPAALLIVATSMAAKSGVLLPVWLARTGLVVAPVMILGGVIGLLPQLMFAVLGLWLVAVSFSLMFRPVEAGVVGHSSVDEPTAAAT